ncbi:mitogen-activated protein kinase kinase kinase 17-like [Durio zibethinus]|uniref:Mitogen-activated protein kinase kinase kinase 17-like n=1 Tax=Durio zibethinus TaxID=66656 RepID=A0A6P6BAC9_DURZI|nr:mitogen-activated protein kinase kinase kinase 17-like [Durio zibethinus]
MDFDVVKGVALARKGLTMDWIKLKTLGKGSHGVVHLVKPTNSVSDDRLFAVKSCRYKDSSSLQKELQIFKQFVGCGNIVQCYGAMLSIDDQGMVVYNLFLEYAPGGNLLDLMSKKYGGKIPECDVKCYVRMLLEGIRDIHQRGYVHCDLKPANILVFPSDQYGSISSLKIADFGLVRRPGERDMSKVEPLMQAFPGTAAYMPPESVTDGKISAALDIWSLGCIVIEMITGKLPWEYQNLRDLAIKIGFSRHPPIPETISSKGKDFLMKCFERDPSERWTADMLLSHPFLLSYCSSLPSPTNSLHRARFNSCLPSMEQLKAICLVFWNNLMLPKQLLIRWQEGSCLWNAQRSKKIQSANSQVFWK